MTADPSDKRNSDLFSNKGNAKWTDKIKSNENNKERKVSFSSEEKGATKIKHNLLDLNTKVNSELSASR